MRNYKDTMFFHSILQIRNLLSHFIDSLQSYCFVLTLLLIDRCNRGTI